MTGDQFTDRLLAQGESKQVEFKASVEPMDVIGKTVCAFLNTDGGVIVIGVDPKGKPNGSATKAQAEALSKYLRRTITPKVLYDVSFDGTTGGNVITVGVPVGPDRPYVFEGAVFTRKGARVSAADALVLRELVEVSVQSTKRWERRPSSGLEIDGLDRELLTETVRRAEDRRGIPFDNSRAPVAVLTQLSLLQSGQLTNAADVLFGKKVAQRLPQTRLRAVCYTTDRAGDFLDEQLYEGPAFRLLEDAMAFLKRHVSIAAEFREGQLSRESKPKYPFNSLREGLVNALVHRDYAAFSGSVSVSVYTDRVEIWNTGKLPRGISPRDLPQASHSSILVNPDIAHAFYLHELMERVGRGTYKIAQECRDFGMRLPEWKNMGAGVRLTLFAAKAGRPTIDLNSRQHEFLASLQPSDEIRVPEYVERFGQGITDRQARRDLSHLENGGFLVRHGAGSKTTYVRTEKIP
ncbi:MAG: putative DNA binding domain-containing protein [Planctomycetota bacterium]|nr:putative DNA binding domain-containing protein [Planctomycetota bacterium]